MQINFPADLFHAVSLSVGEKHTPNLVSMHFEKHRSGATLAVATSGHTLAVASFQCNENDFSEHGVNVIITKTMTQKSKVRGAVKVKITNKHFMVMNKNGEVIHMEPVTFNDHEFVNWQRVLPGSTGRAGIGSFSEPVISTVYGWAKALDGIPTFFSDNPNYAHGVLISGRKDFIGVAMPMRGCENRFSFPFDVF